MSNITKRETVKYLVGFLFGFLLWVFILSITPMPETKVYDCSLAEFHPDFPADVKEECRKIRGQKKQGYV
jgi:hypothetical protein